MVSEPSKQSMARMETDYSKHMHFRWKIKWRLEHLDALGILTLMNISLPQFFLLNMNSLHWQHQQYHYNALVESLDLNYQPTRFPLTFLGVWVLLRLVKLASSSKRVNKQSMREYLRACACVVWTHVTCLYVICFPGPSRPGLRSRGLARRGKHS